MMSVFAAQASAPRHGFYVCHVKKSKHCFIQKNACENKTKSIEQFSWYSSYHFARAGLAKCLAQYAVLAENKTSS